MSLRRIAFGTAAMASVNVLRLVAQFFALPLLARRLSPADYGIVGMAMPFLAFTLMIADAGLGMSLVRAAAGQRLVWSTCFWLSLLLGAGLAAVMAVLGPIAAVLFQEPRLGPIVAALGLFVLAQAAATIPMTMLQKLGRFGVIAGIEIAAVGSGIGTAVLVALHGGGAWALVAQQLVYATVRLTATAALSPFRPLPVLDLASAGEHLAFGRDLLGVNLIAFFTRSMDNLVIGRALGPEAVGVYAMTFQFVRLPLLLVTGPLQYVLYAELAQPGADPKAIRRLFLILIRALATLGFPIIAMVAIAHRPVFTLLLSAKWWKSGELFLILAPVGAVQLLTALGGTIMLALGRTDIQRRTAIEFGVIWLAALLIAARFGLAWVAIAHCAAVLLYSPRSLRRVLKLIGCTGADFIRAVMIPAITTGACLGAFAGLDAALALTTPAQIGCSAALAILGVLGGALTQRRLLLGEFRLWRGSGRQADRPDRLAAIFRRAG